MNLRNLKTKELYTLLAAVKGLVEVEEAISQELNARVLLQRKYAASIAAWY